MRELVDNSLDAGADRIRIQCWPDAWRFAVADNGTGIAADQLPLAAQAHATSKLRTLTDLWQLSTLGFRGEGLHSIAVVARLEIVSCTLGAPTAMRALYGATGELVALEPTAGAPGTVVTVSELFETQPVRRRFCADRRVTQRSLIALVERYALAHPHCLFELLIDGKLQRQFWPAADLKQRLLQMLPGYDTHDLRQVEQVDGRRRVRLVLGLPDRCSRARPDWLQIYINHRHIRHPELEQAVRGAFERTLRRGRQPVCIVHLELPPEEVDWNRHPAKLEVQLATTGEAAALVAATVGQGLRSVAPRPAAELLRLAENRMGYLGDEGEPAGLRLRALAQMQNTYIVAEYPGGLCLIEQHVAHERVLFEELESSWQLVPIDPPLALSLSAGEAHALAEQGLSIEPFGERTWLVRSAPLLAAQQSDPAAVLVEMARQQEAEQMRVALACRSAIRNGTPLSPPQMQQLLDRWQATANPHTCPHGRPIYMPLTDSELARFFKRRWHICGS